MRLGDDLQVLRRRDFRLLFLGQGVSVFGDRMVVFALANIHAGEVDGKEALQMLAREIATDPAKPLLKDLVILLAPIFNADGNEQVDKNNRRSQNGPEEGVGRLAEPDEIVRRSLEIVGSRIRDVGTGRWGDRGTGRQDDEANSPIPPVAPSPSLSASDFLGEHVMITAGPTVEEIDPVRFISNRSSGRMGYAMAEAARDRGASVTLISGPVSLQPPSGVQVVNVISTREMYEAVMNRISDTTVFIGCAAVTGISCANRRCC